MWTVDGKTIPSIMCNAVDKPVRFTPRSELVNFLFITHEPKKKITHRHMTKEIATKQISHLNQIRRILSFLIILFLTMKIEPRTNFDVEYLHILNFNHLNYSYPYKPHCICSYRIFSKFTHQIDLISKGYTKRGNKNSSDILLDTRKF